MKNGCENDRIIAVRKDVFMNWFEKIVHFLDAGMETPTLYGAFHIVSLLLLAIVSAFLIIKFRNADDKVFRTIVFVFWIIIVLLEIYKQVDFSFEYNDGNPYWDYEWYAFPFQFCSVPLYTLPFIVFLKDGKVRDAFISFMCYYSLIAGIAVMAYPGDVFIETIGIDIQTMVHHGSQVVLGIYFAVYKRKKIGFKFLLSGLPVLVSFIALALILNIGMYHWMLSAGIDETFNMFYISPYYDSTLPVFSIIYPLVPYPIFLVLYILALTLGGALIMGVHKGIIALSKKMKAVEG